jgi:hypothetical protein
MKNLVKMKTEKCLTCFLNYVAQTHFIFVLLLSTQIYGQDEAKPGRLGIHAGINNGILSGGFGPSFSLHYALHTKKALQPEFMVFFDSHSGKTFLSGGSEKDAGFGLAAGLRLNLLPNKNWNPSLVIMPGISYSSEITTRYDDPGSRGISGALCLGISNTFYRKHMVSMGLISEYNFDAAYLKYGYWF